MSKIIITTWYYDIFYFYTESASALKGCKTYFSIIIIMYLPISYVVVGCLDLK